MAEVTITQTEYEAMRLEIARLKDNIDALEQERVIREAYIAHLEKAGGDDE